MRGNRWDAMVRLWGVSGSRPESLNRRCASTGPPLVEDFQPRARQLTSPALGGHVPHEGLFPQIKRLLVGEPIPSHLAHHERLSRVTGLAVLSSDALSSVAYATEAILLVLIVGGRAAFGYATPIALLIAALLLIVAFSYRHTIFASPRGRRAY